MLAKACSWIQQDQRGTFSSTRFDNLPISASAFAALRTSNDPATSQLVRSVGRHAGMLHQAWSNALTVMHKVEWLKALVADGGLHEDAWLAYSPSDMYVLLAEIRSGYDHAAHIVQSVAKNPGQVGERSFTKLLNWAHDPKKRAADILGTDLHAILPGTSGSFWAVRESRDDLAHRGARLLVFPWKGEIAFMLTGGTQRSPDPSMMLNANVICFRRYSAYHACRLLLFLEDLALLIFKRLALPQVGLGQGVMACNPGLAVLREWARLQACT